MFLPTPQMFRDLYPIPASLKEKEHLWKKHY